jgi:hypothetical protein
VSLEWGPLSLVSTVVELLRRKSSGCGLENENTAVVIRRADHATPSKFADKRRSLGWYSSLADWGNRVQFFYIT